MLSSKEKALLALLAKEQRPALAFSGGVDSACLLYYALKAGVAVRAFYFSTPLQSAEDTANVKQIARELGQDLQIITLDTLQIPTVRANDELRCYYCKLALMTRLKQEASRQACTVLYSGDNADDNEADRPGSRALRELGVLSPLRQVALGKAEIRELMRRAGLAVWQRPALACLATRIPCHTALELSDLHLVELWESELRLLGYSNLRVRLRPEGALVQLPVAQWASFLQQADSISKRLRELAQQLGHKISFVALDLEGR